mmetsp:Transcript_3004/g.5093  ORF Transcript_3004/g.5093 Transcript_3004/m.5093 type:complete len:238 (-) Transcript_3004:256-969(-)
MKGRAERRAATTPCGFASIVPLEPPPVAAAVASSPFIGASGVAALSPSSSASSSSSLNCSMVTESFPFFLRARSGSTMKAAGSNLSSEARGTVSASAAGGADLSPPAPSFVAGADLSSARAAGSSKTSTWSSVDSSKSSSDAGSGSTGAATLMSARLNGFSCVLGRGSLSRSVPTAAVVVESRSFPVSNDPAIACSKPLFTIGSPKSSSRMPKANTESRTSTPVPPASAARFFCAYL